MIFDTRISCYITHTHNVNIGARVCSYSILLDTYTVNVGDRATIGCIPVGTIVHSIESFKGSGSIYIRSAGTFGMLLKKFPELGKVLVRLRSGVLKLVSISSSATVGVVSNITHRDNRLGKAGRYRWYGYQPTVRGVAMNPVDHPHGGGEGRKSKKSDPRNKWGRAFKYRKTGRIQYYSDYTHAI